MDLVDLQHLRGTLANTSRVTPMGLGHLALVSIEFGQPTRTGFHRQPRRFESIEECPPRRIDGGSILERLACLRQNRVQNGGFLLEEVPNILRSLGRVTSLTGQGVG